MDIIPKPWLTPEGTINYNVLHQMLSSVLSAINQYQGAKFEVLHEKFSMVYSPAALLDILQVSVTSAVL